MAEQDIDFVIGIGTVNNRAEYDIYANGFLYPHDGSVERSDRIVGQHKVEGGVVHGGWDYYGVRGHLTAVNLRPSAMMSLNGNPVSKRDALDFRPARFPGSGAPPDPKPVSPDVSLPSPQHPPEPDDAPSMEKYRPVELGDVGRDEAIGGGTWIEVDNPDPRRGIVSRYASTNRDETLTIDENDSGGWQALINRLPKEFNHRIEVTPSPGRHGGNGSSIRTHPMVFGSAGDLVIEGVGRDHVHVDQGINSVSSGKLLNFQLKNVSFHGLSQFAGPIDVRDCRFEGFDRPGANSSGTAAISGKNALAHMKRNIIGNRETDDYAIWPTCIETYALADNKLNARKAAINMNFGSTIREWGNDYNAPAKGF